MKTKKCTWCNKIKSVSEFVKSKSIKSGLRCYCKECNRAKQVAYRKTDRYKEAQKQRQRSGKPKEYWNRYWQSEKGQAAKERYALKRNTEAGKRAKREYVLQQHYGISLDRHYQLWVERKGRCDLCGKQLDYEKVHTDHNHISDKLRALICSQCNHLLGFAFVDEFGVEILNKAIKYVKRHEQKKE